MNNQEPYEDPDPTPPFGIPRPNSDDSDVYEEPDQASPYGIPRPSVRPSRRHLGPQFSRPPLKFWPDERHPRRPYGQ